MTAPHALARVVLLIGVLADSLQSQPEAIAQPTAEFVRKHDWSAEQGEWLRIDTHTHSQFSDGAWTPEKLVDEAAINGCDAVAITDHADHKLRGASEEYFADLRRVRQQHPELIVLAGLEWNIPPHGGDEHVTVLVEPTQDEAAILVEFKARFDDFGSEPLLAGQAVEALKWLSETSTKTNTLIAVVYNHPGRKRRTLEPFRDEFLQLRAASSLLVGFEGGVGHQAGQPLGAYEGPLQLDERWDPAAATVGGVWDQLLQQGVDAWAAMATSDFHSDQQQNGVNDYSPGKFSETWVHAPERSPHGVLRALQAGAFFGEHGHIVRRVEWTVSAEGLPRAARAGEAIRAQAGSVCRMALQMEVPKWDWQDVANKVDVVEFIGVDANGARVLATFDGVATDQELSMEATVPDGGLVVRARGRRDVFQRPDYVFMTNPIRVAVD